MSSGQFVQWQDLFVLIDDGAITRYDPIEAAIREQARTLDHGVALLCILPPEAKPPPDDVKRSVKSALTRLAPSLSCLAYVIEGTGFRGVAARATLVGMKIFSSRPYPIYVETSVQEAIGKMAAHLIKAPSAIELTVVLKQIADARGLRVARPTSARPGELSVK